LKGVVRVGGVWEIGNQVHRKGLCNGKAKSMIKFRSCDREWFVKHTDQV